MMITNRTTMMITNRTTMMIEARRVETVNRDDGR
jgi:hypothetical protein